MEENKQNDEHATDETVEVAEVVEKKPESCEEQVLRISADFQNFRRRVEREKAEWADIAQCSVVKKFLTFVDDIDRAISASDGLATESEWLEGFRIINKKLWKTLDDMGVKEIDCSGRFSPHFHEALVQVPAAEKASGDIVEVVEKGYTLHDTVLRHAKVSVAK
ncbi:nucleotide exchange factor GrpE [bacterium]|nr:nucleotide exchange factor GrpE [bacterium]